MTLIVYKGGEIAADNGCTRNDSRESARKIRIARGGDCTLTIGYSGNIDAIERHWHEVVKRIETPTSLLGDYPDMNAAGIAVIAPDAPDTDNPIKVFTFNCFDHATGNGVWVREHSDMVCEGADFAVCSALAINHVAPHMSAAQIIKNVAEVNSSVDTRFGVGRVPVVNPDCVLPTTVFKV
jgi:hypothetical protein